MAIIWQPSANQAACNQSPSLGAPRPCSEWLLRVDRAPQRELDLLQLAFDEESAFASTQLPFAEQRAEPAYGRWGSASSVGRRASGGGRRAAGGGMEWGTSALGRRRQMRVGQGSRCTPRLGRANLKVGASKRRKRLLPNAMGMQAARHPVLRLLPGNAEVCLPEKGRKRGRNQVAIKSQSSRN